MEEYKVICRVAGCPCVGMHTIINHEGFPINVICGGCGTEITEIYPVNE